MVNPNRKSEYHVYSVRDGFEFESVQSLQSFLRTKFVELKEVDDMCVGYVKPGHGWKGKQQWLNSEEDLTEMYSVYATKRTTILLWCYRPTKNVPKNAPKRGRKSPFEEPVNKRARCANANAAKAKEAFESLRTTSMTQNNYMHGRI